MSPNDVTLDNAKKVREKLYGKDHTPAKCKLKINDIVRIPLEKNIFGKGYERSWTIHTYIVSRVQSSYGVCYYHGMYVIILLAAILLLTVESGFGFTKSTFVCRIT